MKSPIADPGSDVIFRHGADGGKGGKLKALIIDGRNNHDWKTTTPILKQILETAYSAEETGGTDVHEPMIWIIPYGEDRMFTTVMGHAPPTRWPAPVSLPPSSADPNGPLQVK